MSAEKIPAEVRALADACIEAMPTRPPFKDDVRHAILSAVMADRTTRPTEPVSVPADGAGEDGDLCPDCGRQKARTVHDAAAGMCPKWWAVFDRAAESDCKRHAADRQDGAEEAATSGHLNVGYLYGIADAIAATDPTRAKELRQCAAQIVAALLAERSAYEQITKELDYIESRRQEWQTEATRQSNRADAAETAARVPDGATRITITLHPDRSDMHIQAAPNADPYETLDRAIHALQAERDASAACPTHARAALPAQPATHGDASQDGSSGR